MIAYLTDVEGRWDKVESFVEGNPHVSLVDGALRLADGVTFVFGGDAVDRGPHGRRVVSLLLAARREYGERVVLLAGNRDINKLRLWRELAGHPPPRAPSAPRPELLRWIFEHTMGARDAFAHRAAELRAEGRGGSDTEVVESILEDLAPGGAMRAYLRECRLVARMGATLFVHGAITRESLGVVPGRSERLADVDAWASALNELYAQELSAFDRGLEPRTLIAYQAPREGTRWNQGSVVYGRLTDEHANPQLPDADVVAQLHACGVGRLVVGHTPSGDCPAIVRDGRFELVLADSSHGRVERGSQLVLTDDEVSVSGVTVLDDGRHASVRFSSKRIEPDAPLGMRDRATGQLVKARLADGDYLLFRGLSGYRVEQRAASSEDVGRRALVHARDR